MMMDPSQTTPEAAVADAPLHPVVEFWRYFSSNRGAMIGLGILILLICVALGADVLAPHLPTAQFHEFHRAPPFWLVGGTSQFLLGTDDIGRDILSRIMHGARVSMTVGFLVVILAIVTGIILGLIAGFFQGVVDTALMRLMDILLSLPSLLMAMVIVAILGPSLSNAAVAIVIVQLPHFVRRPTSAVLRPFPATTRLR